MSQRTERIDELLRQEIGTILSQEAKDPRIGFVTITEVETTPDLRHAKVWVSVIGSPAERDATMLALQHTMHFVRRELGTRLRLKRIPELHVRPDDSIERGTRVLRLLADLEEGREPVLDAEPLPTPVRRLAREGDAPEPPPEPSADGRDEARAGRTGRPTGRGGGPRKEQPKAPRRPGRSGGDAEGRPGGSRR